MPPPAYAWSALDRLLMSCFCFGFAPGTSAGSAYYIPKVPAIAQRPRDGSVHFSDTPTSHLSSPNAVHYKFGQVTGSSLSDATGDARAYLNIGSALSDGSTSAAFCERVIGREISI